MTKKPSTLHLASFLPSFLLGAVGAAGTTIILLVIPLAERDQAVVQCPDCMDHIQNCANQTAKAFHEGLQEGVRDGLSKHCADYANYLTTGDVDMFTQKMRAFRQELQNRAKEAVVDKLQSGADQKFEQELDSISLTAAFERAHPWSQVRDPNEVLGEWGIKTLGPYLNVVKGKKGSKTPFNVAYKSRGGKLQGGCGLEPPFNAFCKIHNETNPYPKPFKVLRPAFVVMETADWPEDDGTKNQALRFILRDDGGNTQVTMVVQRR